MTAAKKQLSFIFTSHGFSVDEAGRQDLSPGERVWKKQFEEDRWKALYRLGFEKKAAGSPSFLFLYHLASAFTHVLMTSPMFPFLKGKMEVSLPEGEAEKILRALPYGPGTELVDEPWIHGAVDELNRVFHEDFAASGQDVEDYLAARQKGARIPDRLYFHLVENRQDETYPFAFLATYATFDEEGKARQMPLAYALKEYRGDRDKLLRLFSSLDKAAQVLPPPVALSEAEFRYQLNEDAMATEKLAEGIRLFAVDAAKLARYANMRMAYQSLFEFPPNVRLDVIAITLEEGEERRAHVRYLRGISLQEVS